MLCPHGRLFRTVVIYFQNKIYNSIIKCLSVYRLASILYNLYIMYTLLVLRCTYANLN